MTRHRLPVFVCCLALSSCAAVPTDRAALLRYHWQLRAALDGGHRPITALTDADAAPLQLDFSANAVSVQNACNALHGTYRIVDRQLKVTLLAQTSRTCVLPTMMLRDSVIRQVLVGEPSLALSRKGGRMQLTLEVAGGRSLTFAGVPVDDKN